MLMYATFICAVYVLPFWVLTFMQFPGSWATDIEKLGRVLEQDATEGDGAHIVREN